MMGKISTLPTGANVSPLEKLTWEAADAELELKKLEAANLS